MYVRDGYSHFGCTLLYSRWVAVYCHGWLCMNNRIPLLIARGFLVSLPLFLLQPRFLFLHFSCFTTDYYKSIEMYFNDYKFFFWYWKIDWLHFASIEWPTKLRVLLHHWKSVYNLFFYIYFLCWAVTVLEHLKKKEKKN